MSRSRVFKLAILALGAGAPFAGGAATADACPFCAAEMQTLSEEMADADAVVLGRLTKQALPPDAKPEEGVPYGAIDPETGEARFTVTKVLKGDDLLLGVEELEAIYFGTPSFTKRFLIRGVGEPIEWAIPLELSDLAVEYVQRLPSLPEAGPDRLEFFQDYLEHDDPQLAQDAYDEFARAPYADLQGLADRMDHDRIVEMINKPGISPSRRRLFFVMLGVCGGADDLPMLESLIESDARVLGPAAEAAAAATLAAGGPFSAVLSVEAIRSSERRRKLGLDAMIACYLTLKGEAGLDLVDRRFLANKNADQTHLYSVLMAVRFLADEETTIVPRERLLASARLLLDNKTFADQVITDLARWQDWSIVDRLGQMYRQAGGETVSKYVREPIVTYLDIAAERDDAIGERAAELLAELEPIDPDTFRRARSLASFGFLGRARAGSANASPSPTGEPPAEETLADLGADDEPLPDEPFTDETPTNDPPLPDPATFAATAPAPTASPSGNTEAEAAEPAAEPAAGQAEPAEPPAAQTADRPPVPAGAEPLTPPSRLTLLGAPLLGLVGCFGLFWLILRGGDG